GWARLHVTNCGAGAVFSATAQIHGLLAAHVDGRQIKCEWEGDESKPSIRIAHDETRVIRVATKEQDANGRRFWKVHRMNQGIRAFDEISGVIGDDQGVDVSIAAEPDLIAP